MAIAARTPIPSPSLARPQPPQRRRLAAAPTVTARADLQRVTTPIARAAPFELWILFFWSRPGRADPGVDFKIVTAPTRRYYSRAARFFFAGSPQIQTPHFLAPKQGFCTPPARRACPARRSTCDVSLVPRALASVSVLLEASGGCRCLETARWGDETSADGPALNRESARMSRNRTTRKREAMNKHARKHARTQ